MDKFSNGRKNSNDIKEHSVAFQQYLAILAVLVGGVLERQGLQRDRDHGSVVALGEDL